MTDFRWIPIAGDVGERWRRSGVDDAGNSLCHRVDENGSGSPCRYCLEDARRGDALMLGSYKLPRPQGIYWTASPIFLHAEPCAPFARVNEIPPVVRRRLVSLRAYDREHFCLYDLGHVAEGSEIDEALARALGDRRTAFLSLHTAKPGCMLCQVERL